MVVNSVSAVDLTNNLAAAPIFHSGSLIFLNSDPFENLSKKSIKFVADHYHACTVQGERNTWAFRLKPISKDHIYVE